MSQQLILQWEVLDILLKRVREPKIFQYLSHFVVLKAGERERGYRIPILPVEEQEPISMDKVGMTLVATPVLAERG